MKRINVVGSSASGKTTFGRRLSEALGVEFIEMDAVYWGKNWTEPSEKELLSKIGKAIEGDSWVLDGNYTRTIPIKWAKVDTIIWLDYSFFRTFRQSVTRAVKRSITQEELWPGTGNRESISKSFFSKDSVVLWMMTNYGKNIAKYEGYMNSPEYQHVNFVRLKSPKEAETFIAGVCR
ncbi:adenylate kinase [Hahella sp. CCB-MM4]|uniref:shikimate kinase n=1 Tax=Hahella sp. (strain CCB-MM4) TaxID=1926491 RepID=UPI000B9AB86E|nr:shikimate kinase [Hahella sp. CCB-MM4]OZG71758.1 adenylate kinase [Hahella sp. CCB-MM4]